MEEGDDAVGEDVGESGDDRFVGEADFEEDRLDEAVDEGFAEAAQGDAGEGDAELGGREVTVEVLDLVTGADGAGFAFGDSGFELGAADFDDGEFSGDEESVEEDEEKNGDGAPSEFGAGQIPLSYEFPMPGEGEEGKGEGEGHVGGLGLEALVIAVAAFFQDGESGGFGIAHREGFGVFGGIEAGDEFGHGLLAEGAVSEWSPIHGTPEVEAFAAGGAALFGILSGVRVSGHRLKCSRSPHT